MFYILCIIRFIVNFIDLLLLSMIVIPSSFLPIWINKRFMPQLYLIWNLAFARFLGIEYHIHQKYSRSLPKQGIFVANHPSGVDLLMMNIIFRGSVLSKSEVKHWPLVGRLATSVGVVFVDRFKKDSRRQAKKQLCSIMEKGKSIFIYPEGGCYGKNLHPFKFGACDIAIATRKPIIPIYLHYEAATTMQWGEFSLLQHIYKILTTPNKHVHCYIFDPVYPDFFDDAASFTDYLHLLYRGWESKY